MDEPFILEVDNLSKRYTSRQGVISAVEDISFTVAAGEFVSIVGPSGCGKTTLLRILGGLLSPTSGEVRLQGQVISEPPSEIGIVFQKSNLMPWRTVQDNVLLPLQVQQIPADIADRRVADALKLVGLAEFSRNYPHELSGGMQQRVAIARALAYEPEILLLDEPFGALDALTRERLNQELLQVWEASGKTVVMVTHDIREAIYLSDRVVVLSQRPGRVADIFTVPFPRPRPVSLFYDAAFGVLAYQVRQAIR